MKQLNVKTITEPNTHTGSPRMSEEYDDVINVVVFKGSLMLERHCEETVLIDLADVIHLSVSPATERKVMRD